jgi:hypothetical protein
MSRIRNIIEKLSPSVVSVILLIVTLFCPIMITSMGWGGGSEGNYWIDMVIVALAWTYFPPSGNWNPMGLGVEGYGIFFLNPSIFINTMPVTFLSILFAVQVVRFRTGEAQRRQTLLLGILSILPATLWGLMGYAVVFMSGVLMYFGPIPLQFLIGLLFMKYSANWQIDKAFDDEEIENWWEKQGSN